MQLLKNILLIMIFLSSVSHGQDAVTTRFRTVFEQSGYISTADYNQTMAWFKELADTYPEAEMHTFGKSPQGRDLNYLVVSKEKNFTPSAARRSGKPVVMIVNGIHSGEIEGKDACMILLWEILVRRKRKLLWTMRYS